MITREYRVYSPWLASVARSAMIVTLLVAGCSGEGLLGDNNDEPPTGGVTCYSSFSSFKRDMKKQGKAPPADHDWHHIVEQNPANEGRFSDRLHCTDNLIAIPRTIHRTVSGYYSSKPSWTEGRRVRDVINERTWDEQREHGLDTLRRNGIQP